MLAFIKANIATVIIVLIIIILVFFAVRKIIRNKKAGKGSCGNNCADCPYSSDCNKQ